MMDIYVQKNPQGEIIISGVGFIPGEKVFLHLPEGNWKLVRVGDQVFSTRMDYGLPKL